MKRKVIMLDGFTAKFFQEENKTRIEIEFADNISEKVQNDLEPVIDALNKIMHQNDYKVLDYEPSA